MTLIQAGCWFAFALWAVLVLYFQYVVIRNLKLRIRELVFMVRSWERYYEALHNSEPGRTAEKPPSIPETQ